MGECQSWDIVSDQPVSGSCNWKDEDGSIMLHLNPRVHEKQLVMNTHSMDGWGREERIPLPAEVVTGTQPLVCRVSVTSNGYDIYFNGGHVYLYHHRLPFDKFVKLDYNDTWTVAASTASNTDSGDGERGTQRLAVMRATSLEGKVSFELGTELVLHESSPLFGVLRGGFMVEDYDSWKIPSFNLSIFVSSTFTDTHEERNAIMIRLLPELNDMARPHGVDITFVDMRWGVKDENTDDHKTWDACKVELERCREESCEIFFLSLQGYKYGYRPLPREIDQKVFDDHVSKYTDSDKDELIELAQKWYILDTNSIPPSYVLAKLDNSNRNDYWSHVLNKLLKLLNGLMFEDRLYVGDSVTNWEAIAAMNSLDNHRIHWMKRIISDTITDVQDPKKEYVDTRESSDLQSRYDKLIDDMTHELEGISHIHTGTIDSMTSINSKNNRFVAYVDEFYTRLKHLLKVEVQKVIDRKAAWFSDVSNSGLTGDVCIDLLHHCTWARDKVQDFEGREDLVNDAISLVTQDEGREGLVNDAASPVNQESDASGVRCSVIGKSGTGKTCFMAKLASLLHQLSVGIPVIIRFCGTNNDSVDGVKLLRSIIRQIHFIHGITGGVASPESYRYSELVKYFHTLMATYPAILLIDSIDQLSNDNQERSNISFLEGIKPHHASKIIVSCLPDDYDSCTRTGYWYGCDSTLRQWRVSRVEIKSIGNDLDTVLESCLMRSNRTLTDLQRAVLVNSALQQQEPTALFVRLAARVACAWKSNDTNCIMQSSVPSLINQIFDEVQRNYGVVLTKAVIGFITFSVAGITSKEMEDLLSLDDEVLHEVNGKYMIQSNAASRLPLHVWLRIKNELTGLIVESDQGCIRWYHRQLWETASSRYTEDDKVYYHRIMGRYFCGLFDPTIVEKKRVSSQGMLIKAGVMPVWFQSSNRYINKRRCVEGGYHLVKARLYIEVVNESCTLEHVCAYVKCGNGFRLVSNLLAMDRDMSPIDRSEFTAYSARAYHYLRWLLKEMTFICRGVELNVILTAANEPKISVVKMDVERLLSEQVDQRSPLFEPDSWVRCKRLGNIQDFDPLLMNLIGHSESVWSVAFNHDGSRIVSGSTDHTVKLWDSVTGQVLNTFVGHRYWVTSVSINHDGSKIVSGSYDRTIKLWDSLAGEVIRTFIGHDASVTSVSFNYDGSRIASGSADHTARVWDSATGSTIQSLVGHSGIVKSVAFNYDGTLVVSGSEDNTIKIWSSMTGDIISTLTGHTSPVTAVSFNHDGSVVVSGSDDHSVRLWNRATGGISHTLTDHTCDVRSVAFSPDGSRVVSGSEDKTVKIFDAKTGALINTFSGNGGHCTTVTSVSFNHDGTRVVAALNDKTIKVWDSSTRQEADKITVRSVHSGLIRSLRFNHDGTRIVSGSYDTTIKVWNSVTGDVVHTLIGHANAVTSAVFNHDGSRIVSGSEDHTIKIWDSSIGTLISTFTDTGSVSSVCFNHDGTVIASGSDDNTLKIWDSVTGKVVSTLIGHCKWITSVSFNHDSSRFISGSGDKTIKVWDPVSGNAIHTLTGHSGSVTAASFNHDGSWILSASHDNTVKIWDSSSGKAVLTLTGHTSSVRSASFGPGCSQIVSGSDDNTIKIWNPTTGKVTNSLHGHIFGVSAVAFNHAGTRIASGSGDKTILVWDSVQC